MCYRGRCLCLTEHVGPEGLCVCVSECLVREAMCLNA